MPATERKEVTWVCTRCGSTETSETFKVDTLPNGWRTLHVYVGDQESIHSPDLRMDLCGRCTSEGLPFLTPVAPEGEGEGEGEQPEGGE